MRAWIAASNVSRTWANQPFTGNGHRSNVWCAIIAYWTRVVSFTTPSSGGFSVARPRST